jgi:hypothetical protein
MCVLSFLRSGNRGTIKSPYCAGMPVHRHEASQLARRRIMSTRVLLSCLVILCAFLVIGAAFDASWAGEIHVVGNAGYRYLDGEWTQTIPERIHGSLRAVFALSENDIYVSSDDGLVYYFNGSTWDKVFEGPVPLNSEISAIWGSSTDNLYIIGDNGLFKHYNGSVWSDIVLPEPTTNYYHDIYGFSANDIYVIGRGNYNYIYHCDGVDPLSWDYVDISSLGAEIYCYAVWGTAGDDVYIAGGGGKIIHWNGVEWELMDTGTTTAFYDIWGSASSDLYAVSSSWIFHYDGAEWTYTLPPYSSSGSWYWITGSSATDVLVGGSRDEIVHYDGIEWSELPGEEIGYSTDAIMLSGDFALIPDQNNKIFMYDGVSIERYDLLFWMPTLYAVSCTPRGHFWAAGDAGYVYLFTSDFSWLEMTQLPDPCSDIIAFDGDDICVLSGGRVYHHDTYYANVWNMIGDLGTAHSIWGTSLDDLYVLGGYDKIYHYDGSDWTLVHDVGCIWECPDPGCEEECCHYLSDIWGLSDYCINAVGYIYSYYWHATMKIWTYYPNRVSYDGSNWIGGSYCPHDEFAPQYSYTCVGGSASNDIWFGGSGCEDLRHFDGSSWSSVPAPFCGSSAIWGKSPDNIYFLDGDQGDIYSYNGADFTQIDLTDAVLNDLCGVPGFIATVLTEPAGPEFTVDGIVYDDPYSFMADIGSTYEIGVESPQLVGDDEYWFAGWSDGGDTVHTILVPGYNITCIASFDRTVDITVTTEPEGLDVIVAGSMHETPYDFSMLSGSEVEIGTISPQRYKGIDYYFVEWSDGGDRIHAVTLPAEDVMYTAAFSDVPTSDEAEPVPLVNALHQNNPNPFNPNTAISFSLRERGRVSLAVYDVAGRLVRVLIDGVREAGPHDVTWDGRNRDGSAVTSGVYFYHLEAGEFVETKKMVLLR